MSNCVPCVGAAADVRIVSGKGGKRADAVDVVADYLAAQPDSTVSPELSRVCLVRPLPPSPYRFPELQPLHGVGDPSRPTGSAGQTAPPARH